MRSVYRRNQATNQRTHEELKMQTPENNTATETTNNTEEKQGFFKRMRQPAIKTAKYGGVALGLGLIGAAGYMITKSLLKSDNAIVAGAGEALDNAIESAVASFR